MGLVNYIKIFFLSRTKLLLFEDTFGDITDNISTTVGPFWLLETRGTFLNQNKNIGILTI